jgi:DNA-binding NarL/FixJ family response regulator
MEQTIEITRPRRLRILAVDSHELVLWGLRLLFTAEPWADQYLEARDSGRAVALARQHQPDVAIVDLQLADRPSSELCRKLRELSPTTRILLMSVTGRISARSARNMGASGFVPKSWTVRDIAGAVRMVGLGMTVFAPASEGSDRSLSGREREVLEMIAVGATNREIGERLFLSPNTVKGHASALYRKVQARNRAEAILRGQELGLIA